MKIKRITAIVTVAVMLIALSACQSSYTTDIFAMDTIMTITAYGKDSEKATELAKQKIKQLERLFSVTDSDSEIGNINASTDFVEVSYDTEKIITRALEISNMTQKAFDITIRPVTKLWGFTDNNPHVPDATDIESALNTVESCRVEIENGKIKCAGELDLGAIAKGYAAGCIRAIFDQYDIKHAVVSLGGNVMLKGSRPDGKPWNVGITHPQNSEEIIGILKAQDTSVVTSGGYERSFVQDGITYHHIIDPKTGYPANSGTISATVISLDDTLADALSTAFYVSGVEQSAQYWRQYGGFDMILITDGCIYITEDIYDYFQLKDGSFSVVKLEK